MYVKNKYITAISDAIDFIESNVDGASDEHNEAETLSVLREIYKKMEEANYRQSVNYYVKKGEKKQTKK